MADRGRGDVAGARLRLGSAAGSATGEPGPPSIRAPSEERHRGELQVGRRAPADLRRSIPGPAPHVSAPIDARDAARVALAPGPGARLAGSPARRSPRPGCWRRCTSGALTSPGGSAGRRRSSRGARPRESATSMSWRIRGVTCSSSRCIAVACVAGFIAGSSLPAGAKGYSGRTTGGASKFTLAMDITTLVGSFAAFCTGVSYFPQLKKCWATGKAEDLSFLMFGPCNRRGYVGGLWCSQRGYCDHHRQRGELLLSRGHPVVQGQGGSASRARHKRPAQECGEWPRSVTTNCSTGEVRD